MATRRIGNATINFTPTQNQTQLYNALGRTAGEVYSQPQQSGNLFENAITGFGDNIKNRARAIGNTMGTTFSAPVSAINDIRTNIDRDNMMGDNKARMDAVAKKYGYNSYQDVWDARDAAEAAGDTATLNKINNVINPELQAQATENSNKINDFAANYDDYRKNDYISQKINQDRGKYLGDSLTTLSTAADIAAMTTGLPMGLLANTVQGGVEGVANELSQNGLENFDWGRAGQNALIGAASGAATAGLNKVLPTAKQGGLLRNVASSTGRGALSGTVGGAFGGGLGAAMNNQDVLQGAVSGATQGAVSGGVSGAAMGTVNALGNKIIGKGLERAQTRQLAGEDATLGDKAFNKIAEIQNTGKNWAESGENFNERLTNTLNSGDSAVGNWLNNKTQSKVLNAAGNIGNTIDTNVDTQSVDAWDRIAQQQGYDNYNQVIQRYLEANPDVELNPRGAAGQILTWLDENPNTPTTLGGWAKRAGERVVEDLNDKGAGLSIKDTAGNVKSKINTVIQNRKFQNAIKNPEKMNGALYLGDIADNNVNDIINAYKDAGIDSVTVRNGKLYLTQDDAKHIKVERLDNANMTPKQVRKTMRNATGDNAVVSPEVTRANNVTMGAKRDGKGYDIAHLYPSEEGDLNLRTSYPSHGGTITKQIKNTLGGFKAPSSDISEDTGMPARISALQGTDTIIPQNDQNGNPISEDIANMRINRNDMLDTSVESPETELYRQLTGDDTAKTSYKTLTNGDEGSYTKNKVQITQNATLPTEVQEAEIVPSTKYKTSDEIKARKNIVREITDQFYSPNEPTIRRTNPDETFYNMYDKYGLSSADDIRQAIQYAEPDGLVPTMIREAAGKVGVVDLSDANKLVMDLNLNSKTLSTKMKNVLADIIDSTPSTIEGNKSGVDSLQLMRSLEKMASDAKGTNGTYRIGNQVIDQVTADNMYRVAKSIGENLDKAVTQSGAVREVAQSHAKDIQQMREAFPENQKWQNFADDIANAQTIKQWRSAIKDPTRASIYIHSGDERVGSVGNKTARGVDGLGNIPTSNAAIKNRAANWLFNKVYNSAPARQARIEKNQNTIMKEQAKQTPSSTQSAMNSNQTAVYDMLNRNNTTNIIGREAGLQAGGVAKPAEEYIAQASATDGYVAPLGVSTTTEPATLEGLAQGTSSTTSPTTVSDTLTGTTNYSGFGDVDPVDLYATAMELAAKAGDANAFGTLYNMYATAVADQQKTSGSSNLSATQQTQLAKFDSAEDAINELEDLYNQAGGGQGWLKGNLRSIAGDWSMDSGARTYNQMAEGLVNQVAQAIGKTDSLNTEGEVKRALQLVPSLTDDAQTAQNKLKTLRQMLEQTRANYYNAYGVAY